MAVMKAVWCETLKGSWPNWDKFRANGITRIYVDARETFTGGGSRLSALRDGIISQGFEAGLFRDPSWTNLSAVGLAKQAHADLIAAGCPTAQPCSYMFDVEYHDAQYVIDVLTQWRKARPTRDTVWTLEPFQGGWFSQALVNVLNSDGHLVVMPQAYFGKMEPCAHDAVAKDIESHGILRPKIKLFYDGIRGAPAGFDGAIFTDARLP